MTLKKLLTYALLAFTGLGNTITLGKPIRGLRVRRTDMAEIHIWQPASGGDALADASWDTLAPAKQASEFGTFSGQPSDGETCAINASGIVPNGVDKTYTFKTALTPLANEVKIGADATECARNLVSAIMADGNTDRYGTGTVAHPSVTAVQSTADVQLTSYHYGTDANGIVLAEAATNFVWDGGAVLLSGGLTTWITNTAEVLFTNGNHSAMTANLDWVDLLAPGIRIKKITKRIDNFSPIGLPGSPWVTEWPPSNGNATFKGVGAIYYEASSIAQPPIVIISGPEFVSLSGEVKDLHIGGGTHCDCSANFDPVGVGIGGSIVTVYGSSSRLNILDSALSNPFLIIAGAGTIENERDLAAYDTVLVENGAFTQKGTLALNSIFEIVGNGSLDIQPSAGSGGLAKAAFLLMSGFTTFANSKFDVTPLKMVIGHSAHVEFGPVAVEPLISFVDLRKTYP